MTVREQLPVILSEDQLFKSYTQGLNHSSSVVSGQPPPNDVNPVKSPQPIRNRQSSASPMRFCVQTKDRFVVRVVKVVAKPVFQQGETARSAPFVPMEPLRLTLQDPQKMKNLQRTIFEAVFQNHPPVFIGFQAQLPAITENYTVKASTADYANHPKAVQTSRQYRLGKGVRLCFSCPLVGNGLNIEDFYSGKVFQRLGCWEQCSERPGILNEVLQALKKTVDMLLEQIQINGLLTVLPEVDYVFYPHGQSYLPSQRAWSGSMDFTTTRRAEGSFSDCPTSALQPPLLYPPTSSPVAIPSGQEKKVHPLPTMAAYQCLQRHQNPLLASIINSSRPLSAYGTYFDGTVVDANMKKYLNRQISLSAGGYTTPVRCLSECDSFDMRNLKDLPYHSRRTMSISSISNVDCNEILSDQLLPGSFIGISGSPPTWSSRLASPTCSTLDAGELGRTPPGCITNTNDYKATNPCPSMPQDNNPMTALINEVVDRLRNSPHLPLVVMPTQIPGSPPIVFQLPSPDVIFVGLPATTSQRGHERPRLVASPADSSAFVVTSKVSASSSAGLRLAKCSTEGLEASRFTVTAPQSGSILGVSPEGDLYEFRPSS